MEFLIFPIFSNFFQDFSDVFKTFPTFSRFKLWTTFFQVISLSINQRWTLKLLSTTHTTITQHHHHQTKLFDQFQTSGLHKLILCLQDYKMRQMCLQTIIIKYHEFTICHHLNAFFRLIQASSSIFISILSNNASYSFFHLLIPKMCLQNHNFQRCASKIILRIAQIVEVCQT